MSLAGGTTRAKLDRETGERFVRLRSELGVSSFGLNQMVLAPGQRGRIHRHKHQEEVFLVLEGELTISLEGEEQTLGADELIRVGPEVRRQLINKGTERCVLIALGGHGQHEGRDGEAFIDWDQTVGASPQEVPLPGDLEVG